MGITVKKVELRQIPVRTRFPFRYGIATLTDVPHLIVIAESEIDGQLTRGFAADVLPPKWFAKQPDQTFADELSNMLLVIRRAATFAIEIRQQPSAYRWWRELYAQLFSDRVIMSMPSLLKSFGASLLERAVIDANCRRFKTTFHEALYANLFEVKLSDFHTELRDLVPANFLRSAPVSHIAVRHTVGLTDPLTSDDITKENKFEDGLPFTLKDCINCYGLKYFKIKLPADVNVAQERLTRIAEIFEKLSPNGLFSLDGNEFFERPDQLFEYWTELRSNASVCRLLERGLLLVEQPIHRDAALSEHTGQELIRWSQRPPIIIDESDSEIGSIKQALRAGYDGSSHKNCKGVFKGIANACLVHWKNSRQPLRRLIMTGEDLMNIGPIALLQDLAVCASLGFVHVERNGHHYVAGLQPFHESVREQVSRLHSDLYTTPASSGGTCWPQIAIRNGDMRLNSVNRAPFGYSINIRPEEFEVVSKN